MFLKSLFRHWTYQIFAPGTLLREKYEAFKVLLEHDKRAHERLAELEEIRHGGALADISKVARLYSELSQAVREIVANLRKMAPPRHLDLEDYYRKFDFYVRFVLFGAEYDFSPPFVRLLSEVSAEAVPSVGGKAAHLAALGRSSGLPVPTGFVITTSAFYYFLEFNALHQAIQEELARLDPDDAAALNEVSTRLVRLIQEADVPPDVEKALGRAFQTCFGDGRPTPTVAVRSSAVGEDSQASFAGQYETVLNVTRDRIAHAYKQVLASKYSPEALYYRIHHGITDMDAPMAVLILEMIDAMASGVVYTCGVAPTESDVIEVHATWGLGETLVQGEVSPDLFKVRRGGPAGILERRIGVKKKRMVFAADAETALEDVPAEQCTQACLSDADVLTLANWGLQLEENAGEAQDIEWCRSADGRLHLLQTRPLSTGSPDAPRPEHRDEGVPNRVLLEGGDTASAGAGAGTIVTVRRVADLDRITEGSVLVARNASPRYVRVMGKLSAVVTDAGSPAGHFASVAREFGVPVLVGTGSATSRLESGREVTVHADGRCVYEGMAAPILDEFAPTREAPTERTFTRKLEHVLRFVSPLKLIDPERGDFAPSACRSLHDIIRFAHETAVREMFTISSQRAGRKLGVRKLAWSIPMPLYLLDVGGGVAAEASRNREIELADVRSRPLQAVVSGLNHPGIRWSSFTHHDWAEYDRVVMSGGIVGAESARLASYAVISEEYLNLNLKFGYHFIILDALSGDRPGENHILFRFAGGGAEAHGRALRAEFLCRILESMGFEIDQKGDLVDAQVQEAPQTEILELVDQLARLMGAARLMDMYLKEESQVGPFVEDFLNGRYHFSSVELDS